MATHETRGTKRKCQNADCALPFYDLNRADYTCPNCGAAFDAKVVEQLAPAPRHVSKPVRWGHRAPPLRDPEVVAPDEEIEAAAEIGEAAADPEDEQGADPILEQELDEVDDLVVDPQPEGRLDN